MAKKERTSGKGTRYAFVQLSDISGVFEVTVFSELLAAEGPSRAPLMRQALGKAMVVLDWKRCRLRAA